MKMVIIITAQAEQGLMVAQAWQSAGATGVTIIRTHGFRSLQEATQNRGIELQFVVASMASAMAQVLSNFEDEGLLLLSVVDDALVDKLQDAATSELGDMREPYNGIMLVIDIERAIGIYHHSDQHATRNK